MKHYLSPQVTQIDCYHPRHLFHRQHDHLDHRRCEYDHLERRECEEDLIVIRCGGAPDTLVILLLIPSNSNSNQIQYVQAPNKLMLFLVFGFQS